MLLESIHNYIDDEIQGSNLKIWHAISDFVDLIEKKMNQYCPHFKNIIYKLMR